MTTENHAELPESLCFEADGHVTDVVVTCLADGEITLIPPAAAAHVDACDACTARLGVEALLSVGATDALLAAANAARAPAPIVLAAPLASAKPRDAWREPLSSAPPSRRRRPLPVGAIAAALFVAVLGALPGWMDSLRELRTVVPGYLHALPLWSHALAAVLQSVVQSRSGAVLRLMVAAAFIGMGALLARSMTRKQSLEGGLG
jgi:hypothetical protein